VDEAERAAARALTQLPGFGDFAGFVEGATGDIAAFLEYVEARAAEIQGLGSADEAGAAGAPALAPPPGPQTAGQDGEKRQQAAAAADAAAADKAMKAEARAAARVAKPAAKAAAVTAPPPVAAAEAAAPPKEPEVPLQPWETPEGKRAISALEGMGARVHLPADKKDMDWGILAG
jgi:hypothetical protein